MSKTSKAKLIFKYGVMNSGKTTTLLMIVRNYEDNHKKVLIGKPVIDTKCGKSLQSRLNNNTFTRECDFLIDDEFNFDSLVKNQEIDIIMIDEAHFLKKEQVKQIAQFVHEKNIPVVCFGLKVDFRGEPFEGSSYLFALSNRVEEIGVKAICSCGSIANMNLLSINKKDVFDGEQVVIDNDSQVEYTPVCLSCYLDKRKKSRLEKEKISC